MEYSETENGKAIIEIADRGEGIAPGELERIWDKYYTNRQRGGKGVSGLGLAIVKQTVDQHKGECSAESDRQRKHFPHQAAYDIN